MQIPCQKPGTKELLQFQCYVERDGNDVIEEDQKSEHILYHTFGLQIATENHLCTVASNPFLSAMYLLESHPNSMTRQRQ